MKLSQYAKSLGVSYKTAWIWFRDGKLAVRAERMPTGTIIVFPDEPACKEKRDGTNESG